MGDSFITIDVLSQDMEYYLLQFLDPADPFFENTDVQHPGPRLYLNRWPDAKKAMKEDMFLGVGYFYANRIYDLLVCCRLVCSHPQMSRVGNLFCFPIACRCRRWRRSAATTKQMWTRSWG